MTNKEQNLDESSKDTDKEKTFEEKFDENRFMPAYRSLKRFSERKKELNDELMRRWFKKGK